MMRKKAKKLITTFLSLLLLMMCIMGNNSFAYAQGVYVINPDPEVLVLVPGETTRVQVPIKSVGDDIKVPTIIADTTGTPYTVSQPVIYTVGLDFERDIIFEYFNQYLEFDITVAETATIGRYSINLLIDGSANSSNEPVSTELVVKTQILEEKAPPQLSLNNILVSNSIVGKDMGLSFKLRNEGEITARNIYLSIAYGTGEADSGIIAGYTAKNIKLEDIAGDNDILVNLPLKARPTATPGIKTLTVNLDYKTEDGKSYSESQEIYVNLMRNEDAPDLYFEGFTYNKDAKPGEKMDLVLNIKNEGKITAINPRLYVDESSIGSSKFIKDYYTDYISLKDIKADKSIEAKVPLLISKEIVGGIKELKLNLVYNDAEGVEYSTPITIYPEIQAEGITEDGSPIVIISNVKQSPKKPVAGGKLEVSFDMENKSAIDLNDLKIGLANLAGSTFIPVKSDPYQYLGTLKAGSTKRITMNFTVSENASEGLNTLPLTYSYTGGLPNNNIDIPILDVQNDLGSASKPRLIISQYKTDVEDLRAGSVFNFEFEVSNTHSSVAAKNIIVTVSGKAPGGQSEIFSVTQGSNSFFISKIGPGETVTNSLEMKVRNDAATAAYPMYVTIEYEYDGIEPNPTTGEIGETENHELSLQVMENARPVVDYVSVYSWDGNVTVGNPATMYFEFYNMGKSTLNNVVATVEGDLTSSGGSMYFMGNVMAGDRSYAEFEVIPNVEGMAFGVVKITYEDSNGDEQVYTKDFETMVMGAQIWEPGYPDGGVDVFNPVVPEPKKAILPIWAFVLVLVVIAAIFIPVTRKIVINIYKKQLRKKEEIY
ncbi:MAG: hypothetical protein GX321_02580 [Clostridiales bacterium]|nr:hypothetical protein [Clostridiales bacterium]